MFNDEGLGAAMAQHHSNSRIEVLEKRQVLLLRALRGEFKGASAGVFEREWNAIDRSSPAPEWSEAR